MIADFPEAIASGLIEARPQSPRKPTYSAPFRKQLLPASLKHERRDRPGDSVSIFPEAIASGLIEAIASGTSRKPIRIFPEAIASGLIEALLFNGQPVQLSTFPEAIASGLIEAASSRSSGCWRCSFPEAIASGLIEATTIQVGVLPGFGLSRSRGVQSKQEFVCFACIRQFSGVR